MLLKRRPTYVQVADKIRRAVHLGQYVEGDRLPSEVELARKLGVSRVTLREGIRHLEGEGYLDIQQGRSGGLYVAGVKGTRESRVAHVRSRWEEIEKLFDFRLAVECAAGRLAATNRSQQDLERIEQAIGDLKAADNVSKCRAADAEFHLAVADASENPYLRDAVEEARAGMFLPLDVFDFSMECWSNQPDQHRKIYRAIAGQNPARAAKLMQEHVEYARAEIRRMIWEDTND